MTQAGKREGFNYKLDDHDIDLIIELSVKEGLSRKAVADKFGVSHQIISRIVLKHLKDQKDPELTRDIRCNSQARSVKEYVKQLKEEGFRAYEIKALVQAWKDGFAAGQRFVIRG